MNNPTFSIYIPVKNRPVLLKETLEAIANQTYSNFECVICDDGSVDNTLDVIKDFSNKDKRFRYITNSSSLGDPLSSNRLLESLQGLYGARMDSDDLPKKTWLENSFKLAKDFFPSGGVAFGCQAEIFGENIDIHFDKLKETDPVRWSCWSLFNYELNHSGLIFDRKIQTENNLTYKNYVMNNDWDFISKLSHFGKVSNLASVEVGIRRHSDNVSASYKVVEERESLSVILRKDLIENKLGFIPTDKELVLHCTAHHAPYWKFEEQKFVWDNKENYLSLLLAWLDKLILSNKNTNYFDESILKKVLYEEIYTKAKNNFDNMIYPERFKMLWTGD
jgi:glycosyltransferase involved in cell wall biosynthesis